MPQQPLKPVHTGPYFNMLILSGGMKDLRALPGCLCLHPESQEREIGADMAAPGSGVCLVGLCTARRLMVFGVIRVYVYSGDV